MEYFLQIFGEKSIGWAVAVIMAAIFLVACYRKIKEYFSNKAIQENEKSEQFKGVIDQVKEYPKWHQQSLDIREQINENIVELSNKLDAVSKELQELRAENSEDRATTCRYRILRFNDEIQHDTKHSKEHFDQIMDDITEYENYCDTHPNYKNNKAVLAIENIKRVYRNCTTEGSFL